MSKFVLTLVLLVLCTAAHAQLTGTVDSSASLASKGLAVNLLAGTHLEQTTGNFAFLPPKGGDPEIDTFYDFHENGMNITPVYMPGNIMVDFGGSVQNLTAYTGDVAYKTDHLYQFTFTAPSTGTYRFFTNSIPPFDVSGGGVIFTEKGFTPAPVPETSTALSLAILLALGALAAKSRNRKAPLH